ncbi:sulfatase/phosphatase domain-containing protein [Novipirellula sp. SH528]|uniref:sulfatase/phosphatase domain-containing protein n=1 Tax=Novipirellula sp. SH528 TaxID=3454466 RepID=UPI003FA1856F
MKNSSLILVAVLTGWCGVVSAEKPNILFIHMKEHGHAENTLVIFSADHGPSNLLRGKTTPGESGLRVPFIVRWPGQLSNPGTRSNALVSFVDLYPTFVDAAGLKIPQHLPGYSILPVLQSKKARRRHHLYSAFVAHTTGLHQYWPSRTITDGRWKLTHHVFGDGTRQRYPDGNKAVFSLNKQLKELPSDSLARKIAQRCEVPPAFELYDLQNDPNELQNLFGDPKHAYVQDRLTAGLKRWRQQSSDPFLDDQFVEHFTFIYRKNYERWKSLGGNKMNNKNTLDFEQFIPAWDATPFIGKKDH